MADNTVIHSTAVIEPGAVVGPGCSIGAFTTIGAKVVLGKNCRISSHVVIEGRTTLGDENQVYQFASVGAVPQDLKFSGEESRLVIGQRNIIREYVTLQPGTSGGGMLTSIGDKNLFMACSHVGHDCIIGNSNIFANSCALSGHVIVGDRGTFGGLSGVHQFVRIGDHAFLAAGAMVSQDVPPFCYVHGDRARLVGINVIGMQRAGFSPDEILEVRRVYRSLLRKRGQLTQKLANFSGSSQLKAAALSLYSFIAASSERGICALRANRSPDQEDQADE